MKTLEALIALAMISSGYFALMSFFGWFAEKKHRYLVSPIAWVMPYAFLFISGRTGAEAIVAFALGFGVALIFGIRSVCDTFSKAFAMLASFLKHELYESVKLFFEHTKVQALIIKAHYHKGSMGKAVDCFKFGPLKIKTFGGVLATLQVVSTLPSFLIFTAQILCVSVTTYFCFKNETSLLIFVSLALIVPILYTLSRAQINTYEESADLAGFIADQLLERGYGHVE